MASGHVNRANRPNTWLQPTKALDVQKVLANTEPSTHGTPRHFAALRNLVRYRGIGDMAGLAAGSTRSRMTQPV